MKLPSSWIETTLGKIVVDVQPGFAQKPGDEDEGTTPQVRTHNVSPDGKFTLVGIKHVSASPRELERYRLARGDVIFNNTNSEEWVGKTAIFEHDGEYVFSNHMTRLRVDSKLVSPRYLAAYLHQLWSMGYSKTRAKRWVSQAGIESATLRAFRLPLPTLAEQLRIVDVLSQIEKIREMKIRAMNLASDLGKALFEQHFGVAGATTDWPMESFGKHTTYSKYGPRFPDQQYSHSETGIHILRTTDMNDDGTIRWWESPRLDLSEKQINEHALKPGTLVITRSGSIGPFALFDGDERRCVAGAYLIEFGLSAAIEPEYVRALFATAYVQQMLKKAVRSVAQPNINAPNIQAIEIPIPPIERQKAFAVQIKELRTWSSELKRSASNQDELATLVAAEAFTGEVTANWRDSHQAELAVAVKARDTLLRQSGAKLTNRAPEPAPTPPTPTAPHRPTRQWLLGELSDFQREVLAAFSAYPGQPLLAEDADVFTRFCDEPDVAARLATFDASPNHIRRTLSQLAALGLIAKLTLPKLNPATGERDYLKAFRPLRGDENTQAADVTAMRRALDGLETGTAAEGSA